MTRSKVDGSNRIWRFHPWQWDLDQVGCAGPAVVAQSGEERDPRAGSGLRVSPAVQPLLWIGPFKELLDALLAQNEARPRRDRLRMTRIHDLLLLEGLSTSSGERWTVSYDAVRRYANRWLDERRKDAGDGAAAFIPLMFRPSEAYEFDWSH